MSRSQPTRTPAHRFGARYRVEHTLGEGAVGQVIAAHDGETGARVAIKALHPHLADRQDVRARFLREARILNSLRHPNIVHGLDLGTDDAGHPFLVMEWIDGETLDVAWRTAPLPEALAFVRQALAGLAHLHRRGLVHRDVKPTNIVVTPEAPPRVVVLDLGLAGDGGAAEVGTPTYMAPEQVQGQAAGASADVYAVGVMLYELLAGAPPFTGEHGVAVALQHVERAPPPLVVREGLDAPPALLDVVAACLAKAPADRYESAAALDRALVRALGLEAARPTVDAAASRIAEIAGAAVRQDAPPEAEVGSDVWAVVSEHCVEPRFAETMVAYLVELGVAQSHRGRIDFVRTPRPERWPKTLEALLVERLRGRLDPLHAELDLRLLTGLALMEGDASRRTLLTLGEALGVDAANAVRRLREAKAIRIVERRVAVADAELATGLRRKVRRSASGPAVHRAVARALSVSEGAARAELIARLFITGEAYADAAVFLHRAATAAWAAEQHAESVGLLEQAIRQMARAEAPVQRLGLLRLELAERLRTIGDVEQAVRVAQDVAASAEGQRAPTVAGRAWSLLAEVDLALGHLGEAVQGFEAAAAAFQAGGAFAESAGALASAAEVFRGAGAPDAAFEIFLRADGLLPGQVEPRLRLRIRRGLGETLLRLGELEHAEAVLTEARHLAEQIDSESASLCDWLLGEVHRVQSRFEAARQRLEAAAVTFSADGDHAREARARVSLARVLSGLDQRDAAIAAYRRAVVLYRRLGQTDRAQALDAERAELA